MGTIEYSSNNSGGSWWLTDEDWHALEEAGWDVAWVKDSTNRFMLADGADRWLGALAKSATKETNDPDAAIAEWESVTGQYAADEGCNCCGPPHSFWYEDDDGNTHYSDVVVTGTELRWS